MGHRRSTMRPVNRLLGWVSNRSVKAKVMLTVGSALLLIVALKVLVQDRDYFYVLSEAVHAAGIIVLIFKLTRQKTCSGLSLKSQELTAMFVAVRAYCSFFLELDIHTFLDVIMLVSTIWVIYMMRFKLKSSYTKELDSMPRYYTVVPSLVLAMLIHPYIDGLYLVRFLWAFCSYLESVSVLPQLRLMQNAKMVEPVTSHYVFALGIARFLGFAHWIIQLVDTKGTILIGVGFFWLPTVFIAELIQTFILADFCYYYVKSRMTGQLLTQIPL